MHVLADIGGGYMTGATVHQAVKVGFCSSRDWAIEREELRWRDSYIHGSQRRHADSSE